MGLGQGSGSDHLTPDVDWAFAQYEAVRGVLPSATFPGSTERPADFAQISDRFDAILLDAFGVLNVGETAIPGAIDAVAAMRTAGKQVFVVSNSASVPSPVTARKFERLGFDFSDTEIVTSRDALKRGLVSAPPMLWGVMASDTSEIEELGVSCIALRDDDEAYDRADGIVLLGSADWTDERQNRLVRSIEKRPRPFFVGNPDIVAPREDRLSLEPGYFAHDLARRTGCSPSFFGKPFANVYDLAAERLGGLPPGRSLMVGDTLHTDVLGGAAYGLSTLLLERNGLFAERDTAGFIKKSGILPSFVLPAL